MMDSQEIFEVENIKVLVRRKKMNSLRLMVKGETGEVVLSAPNYVPKKMIEKFLTEKIDWIKKQKEKIDSQNTQTNFADGEQLVVLDKVYKIKIVDGKKNSLRLSGDYAILTKKQGASKVELQKFYDNWRKKELKKILPAYFEKWSRITGLEVKGFTVRNMRSRWGSCNTINHTISINLQVLSKPSICLDYLVLHEVAHIKHSSHNQDFKNFLTQYMPDWRTRRRLLKK